MKNLITILGCTASGKTALAARIGLLLDGEVISADSRQVYRGMDIGTGKDYGDYIIDGKQVPCHLIDIAEPGTEYNIFRYQSDFQKVYTDILSRNKQPVLCGGSGMYLESVLKKYQLPEIEQDENYIRELEQKTDQELVQILTYFKPLHNKTDTEDRHRTLKAILIAKQALNDAKKAVEPQTIILPSVIFGIFFPRGLITNRITSRLKQRLEDGMIQEVENLLNRGIPPERLIKYGLEYRFVTLYLQKELTFDLMFEKLNIAIRQFAKRQMTWFRRMERQGFQINWLDGRWPMEKKSDYISGIINEYPDTLLK